MAQQAKAFPGTYSNISIQKLLDVYAAAPERLNAVLKGLSIKELTARPKKGKWSIQEISIHLADSEIMGAGRMRQTLAEPGAKFAVYDQDVWTNSLQYQAFDSKAFYSAVMLFDALRLTTAKLLSRTEHTDWEKAGEHPEWGRMTLRQLLELYADHGERHFGQILELRSLLKKPLDFPLLLEERLY